MKCSSLIYSNPIANERRGSWFLGNSAGDGGRGYCASYTSKTGRVGVVGLSEHTLRSNEAANGLPKLEELLG
jgi:hypothetical protein